MIDSYPSRTKYPLLLGVRLIQDFLRGLDKNKRTLVLLPCLGADLERSRTGLGQGLKAVKVLVPGNLNFPLDEDKVISYKVIVLLIW